jgi:hypothetical protein
LHFLDGSDWGGGLQDHVGHEHFVWADLRNFTDLFLIPA